MPHSKRTALLALKTWPAIIGPWVALTLLNIAWWRMDPTLKTGVLNVLTFFTLPAFFILIHLKDTGKSGFREFWNFLRQFSRKHVIQTGIVLVWLLLLSPLLWKIPVAGSPPLVFQILKTETLFFLGLPTLLMLWRVLFIEGTKTHGQVLTAPLLKAAYTRPGNQLLWKPLPAVLLLGAAAFGLPENLLTSFLAWSLALLVYTEMYEQMVDFFRADC